MGWFSQSSEDKAAFTFWNELSSTEKLSEIIRDDSGTAHLIFKHSTRCGISSMVKKTFERSWNTDSAIKLWHLDLLIHRDISNAIADKTGVVHQSPQAILIQNGQVLHHASHSGIDAPSIQNTIEQ